MTDVLKNLRTRVSTDAPLLAYFQTQYGKDAKHFIGYKRSPSANDYPSICYVPVRDTLAGDIADKYLISLVVGVHEQGVTNDEFDGIAKLNSIKQLIVDILANYDDGGSGCTWVEGAIVATTDLGYQHPFYELEIQFTLHTQGS